MSEFWNLPVICGEFIDIVHQSLTWWSMNLLELGTPKQCAKRECLLDQTKSFSFGLGGAPISKFQGPFGRPILLYYIFASFYSWTSATDGRTFLIE